MKKLVIFLNLLFFGSAGTLAQSDTLNQRNSNGEKMGWWIAYLDENLEVLEDSVGATHCMYNFYTGRFYHYRFGDGLGTKKYPVYYPEFDTLKINGYILLNGDYVTKYPNGQVRSILTTSNGMLIEYREYFPDGQLHLQFLYGEECDAPIHVCLKEYDKKGNLKYEGLNYVPKESAVHKNGYLQNSDTMYIQDGILDGNKYLIQVTQLTGEEDKTKNTWSTDTLVFDAGKMSSQYMYNREGFSTSNYNATPKEITPDSLVHFSYKNGNQYGSILTITGTVEGKMIKGTITWISAANVVTRTYSFEGYLIDQ